MSLTTAGWLTESVQGSIESWSPIGGQLGDEQGSDGAGEDVHCVVSP
jgi:hypothetical protein